MKPRISQTSASTPFKSETENKRKVSLSVIVPVHNERYLVGKSLERLLSVKSELISEMEVIVVDDGSADGSGDVMNGIAAKDNRIILCRHDKKRGKGAAISTGLKKATKEITVIHDADLEYNPHDIPLLLTPFLEEGADAVYGSRFLSSQCRRVLMFRHSLINKFITFLVNWATDLHLTDVETCYKAIKTSIFKSIPIRYSDFRIEVELSMKLAKRRIRIFEVPIRYLARTREEGKKISFWDGILALAAIVRFHFVEDLYPENAFGLRILHDLHHARRFNKWMADTLRPYIGDRVLEIGAGIGTLTNEFIPRSYYVASDIDRYSVEYLRSYAVCKPYLHIAQIDVTRPEDFTGLENSFDTALLINTLEHVSSDHHALLNLYGILSSNGRAVVLVPQDPALFGTLDEAVKHRERYTKDSLRSAIEKAGFTVEQLFDFNKSGVLAWYLNGKILKRKHLTRLQIKTLEICMPLIRLIDHFLPWQGLSVIAVGRKP